MPGAGCAQMWGGPSPHFLSLEIPATEERRGNGSQERKKKPSNKGGEPQGQVRIEWKYPEAFSDS